MRNANNPNGQFQALSAAAALPLSRLWRSLAGAGLALAMVATFAGAQTPPTDTGTASATSPLTPPPEIGLVMPDTTAGRVMERVLKSLAEPEAELGEDALSDEFKKQVPYAQLKQITAAVRAEHGAFTPTAIEKQRGERDLMVRAKTAKTAQTWQIILGLDEADKITTLLLRPASGADEPELKDWADFDERVARLSGKQNFAAYEVRPAVADGAPTLVAVHTIDADTRLAIGSTFKLYVLGALAESIRGGKAKWETKLAIKDSQKSLPSGKMQDEAVGAEFPLSRFADLMISISDNTATDHLIHYVGRDAVEAYMSRLHGKPELNRPFLTTREMFAIKLSGDTTLMERWKAVDEPARRDMLLPDDAKRPTRPLSPRHNPGEVANTLPELSAAAGWKSPRAIDTIEWFASAEELCRAMADLARLEKLDGMDPLGHALRINPGLPLDTGKWIKIAYKGGSEPGVLNLTWLLTRGDGKVFAVSIGWNDTDRLLEEGKVLGLVSRAIELVGK